MHRRRLRDPRLWIGLALVAGSVLLGARTLAAADDTVGVWTLRADVPAGQPVGSTALEAEQVRFADSDVLDCYWLASEPLPGAAVAARDLAAGELLARSAVREQSSSEMAHLPVVVGAAGAPEDLEVGDVVDVWVVPPGDTLGDRRPAEQVLEEVQVIASARESGPLGEAANRQVLLGLDGRSADHIGELLTSVTNGSVVLIRSQR